MSVSLHSLHVTYPADLISLLKSLVLYYCQQPIELEWQRNFWPIDLFVSTVPCVTAVLQAAFPACFRNAFILPLDSINITNYRLLVLLSLIFYTISSVCYCCIKWPWHQCPLLNFFFMLVCSQKNECRLGTTVLLSYTSPQSAIIFWQKTTFTFKWGKLQDYLIQLFFITSTLEAAIMLSSRICFYALSLKFLIYLFMAHSVPECTGLS